MATPKTDFPPVRACLFDMDGLLINSEDIYSLVTNIILHQHGKPSLPWSVKAQLQGRPGPEAGAIFHAWAQLPLTNAEFLSQQSALQRKHFPSTQAMPGVMSLLSTLSSTTTHLALATSSNAANYGIKTEHLSSLFSYFPPSQKVLGDDPRIPKGKGKPAPDIYLLAMETVNEGIRARNAKAGDRTTGYEAEREVTPEECLVFEDSVPGVEAGRRAGMRVVWCPQPELLELYKGREGEVLAGLTGAHKDDEVAETAVKEAGVDGKVKGRPGEIDDGWGQLLETLEDFPYGKYGIDVKQS